jgi:hypothetical protein
MVKFDFQCTTWINQEPPHRYIPSTPRAGGTAARAGSNVGGTARPRRPLTLPPAPPTTSANLTGIDPRAALAGISQRKRQETSTASHWLISVSCASPQSNKDVSLRCTSIRSSYSSSFGACCQCDHGNGYDHCIGSI